MMYCKNCGEEIDDKAAVCIHCGVLVEEKKKKNVEIKTEVELEKIEQGPEIFATFLIAYFIKIYFIGWHDEFVYSSELVGIIIHLILTCIFWIPIWILYQGLKSKK